MGVIDVFRPATLEEAKSFINNHPRTKLLAGGTDLVLNLRRSETECDYVVSLEDIKELKSINDEGDLVKVGAMTTFTDLINSDIIKKNFNSLINCSTTMGSPQIRNAATLGGNIVNAGSAADGVPCVIALEGILVFESIEGQRRVTCEDYFKNYQEEKLHENEILTEIIIPKTNSTSGYYKLGKRNSLAIARLSAAVNIKLKNNKVEAICICLGAVGRHPFRVTALEEAALNKHVHWLFKEEALNFLSEAVEKSLGTRKTMPFKREAVKGVYKEALKNALAVSEDMLKAHGHGGGR